MTLYHASFRPLLITIGAVIVMGSTGCQATKNITNKFDNGSLNYQKTQQLAPIQMPVDQETAAFTPLYPMPNVGKNTVVLINETGKRYQLPAPYRAVDVTKSAKN